MNMMKLMKQAQKMQGAMQKMQEELASRTYEGRAGGGAVTAVASGDGELKSIQIAPEILQAGDAEMLQDSIVTAVNDASAKAKQDAQDEMGKISGGLGLPGGLGL